MTPFADLLRRYRKENKLNQKSLADLIGVEQSYLSALETGQKKVPSKELMQKVITELKLNETQAQKLNYYQKLSSQKIIPSKDCSLLELEFLLMLTERLGSISDEASKALTEVLIATTNNFERSGS